MPRTNVTTVALVRAWLPLVACVGAIGGCGISDPNRAPAPSSSTPTAPSGLRTPAAVVKAQRHPFVAVAVEYTLTQATWSPDTYLRQKARLAQLSTGRARSQLAVARGQSPAAIAVYMKAAGASSKASLLGTDGPTRHRRVVVAYKVLATGAGRTPRRADYRIAQLTLTPRNGAWLVSTFAIQP
jgi:hypothetical protein